MNFELISIAFAHAWHIKKALPPKTVHPPAHEVLHAAGYRLVWGGRQLWDLGEFTWARGAELVTARELHFAQEFQR